MFGGRQLRQSEKRGDKVGASRAGKTSKRHIVVDGNGLPLGLHVEAGNVHDLKAAIPALESIAVPRRKGRARSRPGGLAADKGYDSLSFRAYLRARGIRHSIAQKQTGIRRFKTHRDLASNRWKVERFFTWLNGFRRLGIRFERHSFIYTGFLTLASILICLRSLLQ